MMFVCLRPLLCTWWAKWVEWPPIGQWCEMKDETLFWHCRRWDLNLGGFRSVAGGLCGLTGSALNHRSLPPEFESRHGPLWRVFYLWVRFITFGGCSTHLAYQVHKSGCKTSIIVGSVANNANTFWYYICFHGSMKSDVKTNKTMLILSARWQQH